MKLLRFVLILCCVSAPAFAEPTKVVVFGDSLTSGYQISTTEAYPAVLQQLMRSQGYTDAEVINMSVAGETAQNAYRRLPEVMAHKPDVVIVELGINDALSGFDPGTQVNTALSTIVDYFIKQKVYVILLGVKLQESAGKMKSRNMKLMYYGIAKNYRIAFYPDFTDVITGRKEYVLADGFHPNANGVKAMVYKTYPLVQPIAKWKKQKADYERKLRE